MSTGSAAIPLLKAAPEPDQVADRLAGGPWRGLELCLAPHHVADDAALAAAIAVGRGVWARGDRPDRRVPRAPGRAARSCASTGSTTRRGAGIERSARFAAGDRVARADDPPVRPMIPTEYRAHGDARRARGRAVPALLRRRLRRPRRHAADRERAARPSDAHRRRLPLAHRRPLARPAGVARARAGARLHASTPRTRPCSALRGRYPSLFGLASDDELDAGALRRGAGTGSRGRARLRRARAARRGPAVRQRRAAELDPVVRRLGELVPYIVAEINEPDPGELART